MNTEISEEEKEHFELLIESGDKLEAIRYAQQTFNLDAEQAITMVEKVEQQLDEKMDAELEKSGRELEASTANLPGIIGGIFSSIGVILIILAAYFGYRSYVFLGKAVVVPGVVTGFKERQVMNSNDKTISNVQAPMLLYHYEGKDYTYESPYATSVPEYAVGDQISLLIDPAEPNDPEENTFMNSWFVPMLLGSIGFVFAGLGIIVMRAFRKPQPYLK